MNAQPSKTRLSEIILIGLVVIILSGLVIPVTLLAGAKEKKTACAANLTKLYDAMLRYETEMNANRYPDVTKDYAGQAFWEVLRMYPTMDDSILADEGEKMHSFYVCPVRGGKGDYGVSDYRGPVYMVTDANPGAKVYGADKEDNHGDDTINVMFRNRDVREVKKGDADWVAAANFLSDFGGNLVCKRIIAESIKIGPQDDLSKLIAGFLTDLRDESKRPKVEAILVGLKEKVISATVESFRKEWTDYQSLDGEIKELLPKLGVDDWEVREKTQARLEAIGYRVLPFLKEAQEKTNDPEIRSRAKSAITHITQKEGGEMDHKRREFTGALLNIWGNLGSLKPPVGECFIKTLGDPDAKLRQLSYVWLKKLTGKDLPFNPAKPPADEAEHIKAWEKLISEEAPAPK